MTKPTIAVTQDQVAAVMITPTTPKAWSDIEASLAPNFTMTGDTAATKVLASSATVQEAALAAGGASFQLGLPQSSKTVSDVTTQTLANNTATTGGVSTITGNSGTSQTNVQTDTSGPGVVPTAPSTAPGPAQPTIAAPSTALGQDVILQYGQAFNANEFVQLKNAEPTGTVRKLCYVPFLVDLKVTVDARRTHLPYLLDLSGAFFNGKRPEFLDAKNPCINYTKKNPVVVPILVTDDVQVETRSSAQQNALLYAAAISVMSHGVGAQLGGDWAQQRYKAIQDQELFSQVTIGQPTNSSLYVTIAPGNEGTDLPSQARRTYDIYVVLEVPKPYFNDMEPAVRLNTLVDFESVVDGTRPIPRSTNAMVGRFFSDMAPLAEQMGGQSWLYQLGQRPDSRQIIWKLINLVIAGDSAEFNAAAACPFSWGPFAGKCYTSGAKVVPANVATDRFYSWLWTDLSSLVAYLPGKSMVIYPPQPTPITVDAQTAMVLDDGKTASTVALFNVEADSVNHLSAVLDLVGTDDIGKTMKTLQAPPTAVKFDATTHSLTLTFPSPAVFGIAKLDESRSFLRLGILGCTSTTALCPLLNVGGAVNGPLKAQLRPATSPNAAADFKSSIVPQALRAEKAVATTSLTLPDLKSPETVAISATGGFLNKVTDEKGNVIAPAAGVFTAASKGLYVLTFSGLVENTPVVLTLQGMHATTKTGSTTITLPVVAK